MIQPNQGSFFSQSTEIGFEPLTLDHHDFKGHASNIAEKNSVDALFDSLQDTEETMSSFVPHKCDDRVKSGESLFKMFMFEPSQFEDETEKCRAFWKYLKTRDDIKAVPCKLWNQATAKIVEKMDKNIQTDEEKPLTLCAENCPWTQAWYEIEKRGMDKVSKRASRKPFCKLCQDELAGVDRPSSNSSEACYNKSEIVALNDWNPFKKETIDREVEYPYDDIFSDKGIDVATSAELLAGPQEGDKVIQSRYVSKKNKLVRVARRKTNKYTNTDYTREYPEPDDGKPEEEHDSVTDEEFEDAKWNFKKRVSFFKGTTRSRKSKQSQSLDFEIPVSILKGSKSSIPSLRDNGSDTSLPGTRPRRSSSLENYQLSQNEMKHSFMTTTFRLDPLVNSLKGPCRATQTSNSSESVLLGSACLICGKQTCQCKKYSQ